MEDIGTVICDAAHGGVQTRVSVFPMGDANPQPGAEIALHLADQVTRSR